jgi:hypothetical protein
MERDRKASESEGVDAPDSAFERTMVNCRKVFSTPDMGCSVGRARRVVPGTASPFAGLKSSRSAASAGIMLVKGAFRGIA